MLLIEADDESELFILTGNKASANGKRIIGQKFQIDSDGPYTYWLFSKLYESVTRTVTVHKYEASDVYCRDDKRISDLEMENKLLKERLTKLEEMIDRPNGVGSKIGFLGVQDVLSKFE